MLAFVMALVFKHFVDISVSGRIWWTGLQIVDTSHFSNSFPGFLYTWLQCSAIAFVNMLVFKVVEIPIHVHMIALMTWLIISRLVSKTIPAETFCTG